MVNSTLSTLLHQVSQCDHCLAHLPRGPRPVVQISDTARLLIIGQAPGTRVHETGIPWNDPSGDRLRRWLALDKAQFYDAAQVAIMPMGFCYPGKGRSGDLPPRPECAPKWHAALLSQMPDLKLTLLIGQYAQSYYLHDHHKTLTSRVADWRNVQNAYLPLPHPSPRNQLWLRRNPWFEQELVPHLQQQVHALLKP